MGRGFVALGGPDFGDGLERWFGAQPKAAGPPGGCPATVRPVRAGGEPERAFAYIGARAFPRAPADPFGRVAGSPSSGLGPRASGLGTQGPGGGRSSSRLGAQGPRSGRGLILSD
jgi:hypothetical protein